MELFEYGPFAKYATKYEYVNEKIIFPYRLPFEIEMKLLSLYNWKVLSCQHLKFFLSKKSDKQIFERLEKLRKDKDPKRLLYLRSFYVDSIDINKLDNLDPITKFKYYLYKYGFETCIDGLSDMLHGFLYIHITKELLQNTVKTLTNNNIDFIPEFVVICYINGVGVNIDSDMAHVIIYNIWNRRNFIHYDKTQEEINNCINTMLYSIDFMLIQNDLYLMFLLFNMAHDTLPPTKTLRRILSYLSTDPAEQMLIGLEIPLSNIPDTEYNGFPNNLKFDYIDHLADPINNISINMLRKILKAIYKLEFYFKKYKLSIITIQSMIDNSSILTVMKTNINTITYPCFYSTVCDKATEPIKDWNSRLYFKGCRRNQEKLNPDGRKQDTKLVDVDYTYIKFISNQEITYFLTRPVDYVSIYGYKLIFNLGLSRGCITNNDITKWIVRTYHNWNGGDGVYENYDVISNYFDIIKHSKNTSNLVKILCTSSDSTHTHIYFNYMNKELDRVGRIDLLYDVNRYNVRNSQF